MQKVIITAPSLDPTQNVSGVSSVAQFIIDNNTQCEYHHFQLGKSDKEKGLWNRISRIFKSYREWKEKLSSNPDALIHYSFPLSAPSILRDPVFMYYAYRKMRGTRGSKGARGSSGSSGSRSLRGSSGSRSSRGSSGSRSLRGLRGMVVHVHGGLFLTAPKIPFVLNKILKWVFSWDVPFIVLSEGEKKTLQERFGAKRVYVLPNCPSLPCGLPQTTQIGTDNSTLVMGYLGRIEPNKGMTELLEACKILKKNGVRFLLRFAGKEQMEGEYLPRYEELNEDVCSRGLSGSKDSEKWFEYVGLVSGETKDAFLRSLDVFVMPTYFEGLPVSLLECMGYGAVPVVTPVGSIPDVVKALTSRPSLTLPAQGGEKTLSDSPCSGRENGVFVKVRDVESIVDAVTMLYNDRGLLQKLSCNARKTISENFSAEKYVEKLNEVYASFLK